MTTKETSMRSSEKSNHSEGLTLARFIKRLLSIVMMVLGLTSIVTVPSLLCPDIAVAQDDASAAGSDGEEDSKGESALFYYAKALGWVFGPAFLLLSFYFVSLLVMCLLQIRRAVVLPDDLREEFEAHLDAKEYQQAYELVKEDDSYFGRVMAAGMARIQSGYSVAIDAMRETEGEQAMLLEHKVSYVSLVGAIAPMLGLLGTVSGMVGSFQVIAQSATAPKPAELAGGISQALVTTLIGLMIAIPATAAFSMLKNWLQVINTEIDSESLRLMSRFQGVGKK